MDFLTYIIIFLIFSFIGFILDTIYCSIEEKKFVKSGYIPYLPFCPLYGFGGLLLFILQKHFGYLPWYMLHLIGLAVVMLAEYIGGVYCVKVLKEPLWDYSSEVGNVGGHISLLHGFYWFIVVFLFIKIIFPIFASIESRLLQIITLNDTWELVILLAFIFVFVALSYIEFARRLKKKKKD